MYPAEQITQAWRDVFEKVTEFVRQFNAEIEQAALAYYRTNVSRRLPGSNRTKRLRKKRAVCLIDAMIKQRPTKRLAA